MDIKIAAAYIRVSTDDQLEYSPDSQLKVIRDYAKREGYVIPDEYVYREDDGISGKSASKRPAFRLMVAQAKESPAPFESIFVWKFSRFARNQEEAIMYKNLLKKKGITVRSISEPSSDSPFASLIERIIEWMDEYYLINLAGEVKRGMAEKATRGEAMGNAPLGYCVKDKVLVPDENADIVRWIFEQYAAGRTMRDIAVELGNTGFRGKRGKAPDIYTIGYILRNPVYVGKTRWTTEEHTNYRDSRYLPQTEDMPDGKHEALISAEMWEAVQARLGEKNVEPKYVRKGNPSVTMLKGLLRCSECGSTMIERKERKALRCYKYSRGQCHADGYISIAKANAAVIEGLENIVASGAYTFVPQTAPRPSVSREWDKLIDSERNRLNRAKEAYLDSVFTADEYKQARAQIEDNISRLEAGKAAEEKEMRPQVDAEAFTQKCLDVISVLKSPDVDDAAKNQALRSIVDKIVFDKAKNTYDFYFAG